MTRKILARSAMTLLAALPAVALAQATRIVNPTGAASDFPAFLDMLLVIFQFIATPLLVVALIWGGFKMVTAQGDEKQVTEAKRIIVWTIVAAAIILGARVIYDIAQGTVNPFLTAVTP